MSTMTTRRKGFTLVELLVVIAIIAILAAILFPVFAKAKAKAQSAACITQLRELTMGSIMYADDNSGLLPPTNFYDAAADPRVYYNPPDLMADYTDGGTDLWLCPAGKAGGRKYSYSWNGNLFCDYGNAYIDQIPGWLKTVASVKQPSRTALLWDGSGNAQWDLAWYNNGDAYYGINGRHAGFAGVGFCDGHAKAYDARMFATIGLGHSDGNYWVHSSVYPPKDPDDTRSYWQYFDEEALWWTDPSMSKGGVPAP